MQIDEFSNTDRVYSRRRLQRCRVRQQRPSFYANEASIVFHQCDYPKGQTECARAHRFGLEVVKGTSLLLPILRPSARTVLLLCLPRQAVFGAGTNAIRDRRRTGFSRGVGHLG